MSVIICPNCMGRKVYYESTKNLSLSLANNREDIPLEEDDFLWSEITPRLHVYACEDCKSVWGDIS